MAMSTTDFDTIIAASRAEVEALKQQMQPHYEAFLEATRQFLAAKYREAVDTIAKSNPARLLTLGTDGVRTLKARVNQYIAKVPRFVEDSLNRDRLWSHKQNQDGPSINEYYKGLYHAADNPPRRLTELVNRLQTLLEGVAFFMVQQGFAIQDPVWTGGVKPRFLGRLEMTRSMLDALEAYGRLHDRLVDAYIALGTAEMAKLKAGVEQLWEQS
jgi:hypothetical protein